MRHSPNETQTLWDTNVMRHKRYETQTLWDTNAMRHKTYETQTLWDINPMRHKPYETKTVWDTHAVRHKRSETDPMNHKLSSSSNQLNKASLNPPTHSNQAYYIGRLGKRVKLCYDVTHKQNCVVSMGDILWIDTLLSQSSKCDTLNHSFSHGEGIIHCQL
jgi:hypothetical protein